MKPLFYYALAALFAVASGASFMYTMLAPKCYGFALAALGAIAMRGCHVFANKAGDRGD